MIAVLHLGMVSYMPISNNRVNMTLQNKERHDPYAALSYRDFRLLLTGRFITSFGNEMLSFAIGWELWLRPQAFVLGMVGLVQVIPVILLSLPAGHVADQYNRKRIVLITELFLALCVLGLGWLSYTQGPIYWFTRSCWGSGFRVPSMTRLLRLCCLRTVRLLFLERRHLEYIHLAVGLHYRTRSGRTADRFFQFCDLYLHFRRAWPRSSFASCCQ